MNTEKKPHDLVKTNGIVEELATEIGYTATTALLDWFGGTSLWIPKTAIPGHAIEKVIGESAFRRLVQGYGFRTINLPLDHRRELSRRNRMIGAMILRGMRSSEIAKVALMTERQVCYVRVSLEEAGLLPYILGKTAYSRYLAQMEGESDIEKAPAA